MRLKICKGQYRIVPKPADAGLITSSKWRNQIRKTQLRTNKEVLLARGGAWVNGYSKTGEKILTGESPPENE